MINLIKIGLFLFLCLNSISVSAQSFFRGAIVGGLNLSQIDGDQLAGYDKFGFSGGIKVEFPLNSSLDMGLEFLFSQRGSRSALIKGRFTDISRIHLNYAELPLIIKWNDWWIEETEYYKFNVYAGLSGARLISYQTNFSSQTLSENLNKNDLSALAGLGFAFNRKTAISLRYTRSLNRLYNLEETNNQNQFKALLGYFITLRFELYLN